MDRGPFRSQRPDERRTARPVRSQQPEVPEEQPVIKDEPKAVYRATPAVSRRAAKEEKSTKRRLLLWALAAVVIVLGAAGSFLLLQKQADTGIDESKYQAVFLANGQVYFGKLESFNEGYMKLKDIFYLQAPKSQEADSENPQKTTTDQENVQLIKLGDEIHSPQDEMIISRDQLMFYENIKTDGKVVQSIEKYKKTTN